MAGALQAERVDVVQGRRRVVQGVSLQVAPGEIVGLLGPNGSGKSTLLKAMLGLKPAAAGRILLDGAPLAGMDRRSAARRIGYLPQDAVSDWPLKVRHVVSLGRTPELSPLRGLSAADLAAVEGAMALMDCSHLADRPVTALSGGERSRVMMARVLAGEPDYLLLDEPATGLDPHHQLRLLAALAALARPPQGKRRGILLVLHDLVLAARFCDRVHLIAEGRTLADGPPATALSADSIERAFAVRPLLLPAGGTIVPLAWEIGS
ncbi:ABC transporter ATP-binding protein [Marinibaculum pumilum]|uniref:ABC transporter ATP-binding protein n=1 Tax=Marinibaculum pumilum TaxID=1766165 RepID=A0ABV7L7U3_9PROT